MADKQISELAAASSFGDDDLFAIQQSAATKKMEGSVLKSFVNSAISGIVGTIGALAHKDSASATYTPAGTVGTPTFEGTEVEGTATYTPAGTVSKPNITVTPTTKKVYEGTGVGTLPSLSLSVSGEAATLNFSEGTLPTRAQVDVVDSVAAELAATPTFEGTQATIKPKVTAAGTVSTPSFTGTEATITSS